jgi:hypothetical protein
MAIFFYLDWTRILTQMETTAVLLLLRWGINLVCSFPSLDTISLSAGGYATLLCVGVTTQMSVSLRWVLVVLIHSKRSGQKTITNQFHRARDIERPKSTASGQQRALSVHSFWLSCKVRWTRCLCRLQRSRSCSLVRKGRATYYY